MEERARQRSEMIKKAKQRKAQKEAKEKEQKESKSSSSSDESSDIDEDVVTPDVSDAEDVDQLLESDGHVPNDGEEQQQPHDINDCEMEPSSLIVHVHEEHQDEPIHEEHQDEPVHEEHKDEPDEMPKKSASGRIVRKRKTTSRGSDFIRTDSLAFGGSSSDVSDSSKYSRKK